MKTKTRRPKNTQSHTFTGKHKHGEITARTASASSGTHQDFPGERRFSHPITRSRAKQM